jgi:outer membrane protein assembly factor BamA
VTRRFAPSLALLVAGAVAPLPLAAQEPEPTPPAEVVADSLPPSGYPWLLSYFPYVAGGVGGGPVALVRVRYFQPAPYSERQTFRAEGSAQAGIGFHGSRLIELRYHAPLLSTSVRLSLVLGAKRNTRENFFGLGNGTVNDDAAIEADEFAYRMHRTQYDATAEVTRRIKGPLKVALLGGFQQDRFYQLSPGSALAATAPPDLIEDDAFGRVAVVFDGRDNEFDPTSGLLLETGVQRGSGGDGYTRVYGIGRAYQRVGRSQVALRVGASQLYDSPTLAARFDIPAWEQPLSTYGGSSTNRGLKGGRFVGSGVLFANIELRREILTSRNALSASVIGFVDFGRVFEGEKVSITTDDVRASPGLGLAVRILRSTTVLVTAAHGTDGMRFAVSGGWAY